MIECPWCSQTIEIKNGRCPNCKQRLHAVTDDDFEAESSEEDDSGVLPEFNVADEIVERFKCSKCGETGCGVKEVAMTGTGISKLLDIEHNHYLFVSCTTCGFVEVYDSDVLRGYKSGKLGTVLDLLFGRL